MIRSMNKREKSPKEMRDRLFKTGRPLVRRMEILDGEQYSKDIAVLWAAYLAGSFDWPSGLSQEEFTAMVENLAGRFTQLWIVDDRSTAFDSGSGPIAIIGTNTEDLSITAESRPFKWASKRGIVRYAVAFLQMLRHSTKVGVCFVKANKQTFNFFRHLHHYDVAHYVGKIGNDAFLFSVRGRAD